jgi:hypothetical protein
MISFEKGSPHCGFRFVGDISSQIIAVQPVTALPRF